MVAAGANHSLCLTDANNVYSCGYNAKGQLGLGDEKSVTLWTHVTSLQSKKVDKIFAGGDHSWSILGKDNIKQMNISLLSKITLLLHQFD